MRLWSAWVAAWSAEESGTSLALFRIAVALIVTLDALSNLIAGVVDPLFIPLRDGGLATGQLLSPVLWLFGHSSTTSHVLSWTLLGFGVLSLVGAGGRVTQIILLQSMLGWHAIQTGIGGSYDSLITCALFLLALGDSTATLSVDCRLRRGTWTCDTPILALPRYLGIVQITILYTATGMVKDGLGWDYPYLAVLRSLQIIGHSRFEETSWLYWVARPSQVATFVALYWERSFFVLLPWLAAHLGWLGERVRRWSAIADPRPLYLGLGIVTHGVLGLMMNVGTFSAITISFYVLFYSPEAWQRLGQRFTRADG